MSQQSIGFWRLLLLYPFCSFLLSSSTSLTSFSWWWFRDGINPGESQTQHGILLTNSDYIRDGFVNLYVPNRMKRKMMGGWQKIHTFSGREGCADVRPRVAMAFCFWIKKTNARSDTKKLQSHQKCSLRMALRNPLPLFDILLPWFSLFRFSDILTDQTLDHLDWIFMSLVFSHLIFCLYIFLLYIMWDFLFKCPIFLSSCIFGAQ